MKLIIAEKPSVAQTISKVTKSFTRHDGYTDGGGYIVSWCYGHLVSLDTDSMTGQDKTWSLSNLPIIPSSWSFKTTGETSGKQLRLLKSLEERKDVESVVCATDAGREGELIFRLVYSYTKMKKPIERLWTSSLEESAIKEGLENLEKGEKYIPLTNAAYARMEADWIVGINATRLYTTEYRGNGVLNVGRVQTPTLNMVVERQKEIDNFTLKSTYVVKALFPTWNVESNPFNSEEEALMLLEKCKGKTLKVKSVTREEKKQFPPLLYSLNTLQQDANRIYSFSAQKTLDIAQKLYEEKLITYPRTDSTYITHDMIPLFVYIGKSVRDEVAPSHQLINPGRLSNDKKVTDHSALLVTKTWINTRNSKEQTLSNDERKIISLIENRILASLSTPYMYEEQKVEADCEGVTFKATGRKELSEGFKWVERELLKSKNKSTTQTIPDDVKKGDTLNPKDWKTEKRDSKPASPYTEATLLAAMDKAGSEDAPEDAERKGLGTSATRAGIIENLISNGFMIRVKGKKGSKEHLEPTDKGKFLTSIVNERLKNPKTTAEWEWRLKGIEKNEDSISSFIKDIEDEISSLIEDGKKNAPVDVIHAASNSHLIGKCPVCGKNIKEGKTNFYCENRDCNFVIWKNASFHPKHEISEEEVKKLLNGSAIPMQIWSQKKNKAYDAFVTLKKGRVTDSSGYLEINFQ